MATVPQGVDSTARRGDLRRAALLAAISVACMVVEAALAIGAGLRAGSLLLEAFGLDSLIELISAGVLYWRLRWEMRAVSPDSGALEAVERRASQVGGYLLFALAVYVVGEAAFGLLHRQAASVSFLGLGVAVMAALGMPVLARAKLGVAERIGSRALRADAMESLTCGYLSWALLAGLLANVLLGWWWLDSAAALLLVPLLIREGREALRGEDCSCGHSD